MTRRARVVDGELQRCAEHSGWVIHRFYLFEVLDTHREICSGVTVRCARCASVYDRPEVISCDG